MSSQFKNECNWVILVNMTERGPLKIHPTIKFIKKDGVDKKYQNQNV